MPHKSKGGKPYPGKPGHPSKRPPPGMMMGEEEMPMRRPMATKKKPAKG